MFYQEIDSNNISAPYFSLAGHVLLLTLETSHQTTRQKSIGLRQQREIIHRNLRLPFQDCY